MRRWLVLVSLVCLLLFAGCNSLKQAPQTDREILTPALVEQFTTRGPSQQERVTPGVTRDALVDPERLLRRHEASLNTRRHISRREVVCRESNGTIRSVLVTDIESNETAARIRQSGTASAARKASVLTVNRWSTNNVTYTSITRGDEASYSVSPVLAADRQRIRVRSYSASLSQILSQLEVTVGEPNRRDGTTTYPADDRGATQPCDRPERLLHRYRHGRGYPLGIHAPIQRRA